MSKTTNLINMPSDVIKEILVQNFTKAEIKDVLSFLKTNSKTRAIDEDPNFWRAMLKKHFPERQITVSQDNEIPDYKKIFIDSYKQYNSTQGTLYLAALNTAEPMPKTLTPGSKEYFEAVVSIFNKTLNKGSPGPHIHIAKEADSLSIQTIWSITGFSGTLVLNLPASFKMRPHDYEEDNFIPMEKITIKNIVSCNKIPNPSYGLPESSTKEITLKEMKEALSQVSNKTKGQLNYKIAEEVPLVNTLFKKLTNQPKSNVELNQQLEKLIQDATSVSNLLEGAYKIRKLAYDSSFGEFANGLDNFFKKDLGISNYNSKDTPKDFMKKCQACGLISTVPAEVFKPKKT